jgi:hypothetical protein
LPGLRRVKHVAPERGKVRVLAVKCRRLHQAKGRIECVRRPSPARIRARQVARGVWRGARSRKQGRKKNRERRASRDSRTVLAPAYMWARMGRITAHICTGIELTPCPHPGRARTFPAGPSEVCEEKRRRPDGVSAAALFGVARWPFRGEGDTPVSASRAYHESSWDGEVESAGRMLPEGV